MLILEITVKSARRETNTLRWVKHTAAVQRIIIWLLKISCDEDKSATKYSHYCQTGRHYLYYFDNYYTLLKNG